MHSTKATERKVTRSHGDKGDITDMFDLDLAPVSLSEDIDQLALQMTEDFGRSRRYWLKALTTTEEA